MRPKKLDAVILVALPTKLKEELKEESRKVGRSLNNYVLWILVNHINKLNEK